MSATKATAMKASLGPPPKNRRKKRHMTIGDRTARITTYTSTIKRRSAPDPATNNATDRSKSDGYSNMGPPAGNWEYATKARCDSRMSFAKVAWCAESAPGGTIGLVRNIAAMNRAGTAAAAKEARSHGLVGNRLKGQRDVIALTPEPRGGPRTGPRSCRSPDIPEPRHTRSLPCVEPSPVR